MKRLSPSRILVLGGKGAVSKKVEDQLKAYGKVERIAGAGAVDTALAAYNKGKGSWNSTCIVAPSASYHDALSIAPFAYAKHAPIFLADSKGSLAPKVLEAIKSGGFKRIVIVGGTASVGPAAKKSLEGIKGAEVVRLSGATAIETSAATVRWELAHGMTVRNMGVATSEGYWDALSGAALCGACNSVLALACDGRYTAIQQALSGRRGQVDRGVVLGGPGAASERVYSYAATGKPEGLTAAQSSQKFTNISVKFSSGSRLRPGATVTLAPYVGGLTEGLSFKYVCKNLSTGKVEDQTKTGKGALSTTFTVGKSGTYQFAVDLVYPNGRTKTVRTASFRCYSAEEAINAVVAAAYAEYGRGDPTGRKYENALLSAGGSLVWGGWGNWCTALAWWTFRKAGFPEMWCDGSTRVEPQQVANWYINRGRFTRGLVGIKKGDIVFAYYSAPYAGAWISHAGIVCDVSGNSIQLFDGNPSVRLNWVSKGYAPFVGYARPFY